MMISGHKTRSVFDRYNIVSDQDLGEAAKKKQIYHEKQNSTIESIDHRRGEIIPLHQGKGQFPQDGNSAVTIYGQSEEIQ
jgi:hypothetical protein